MVVVGCTGGGDTAADRDDDGDDDNVDNVDNEEEDYVWRTRCWRDTRTYTSIADLSPSEIYPSRPVATYLPI